MREFIDKYFDVGMFVAVILVVILTATLTGCSHNISTYSDGLGLYTTFRPDSGNFGLEVRYGKIWSFVMRENAEAEMTGANSLDAQGNPLSSKTDGNVKIKVGPQTTGYEKEIVTALKDNPEAVKAFYDYKLKALSSKKNFNGDNDKAEKNP